MNRNDILDVLTLIAAYDHRTVGEADVIAWKETIGELPREPALKAVTEFRREQPGEWLEAGHIYQRVRAKIRDDLAREPDALREARQAALEAKVAEDAETRTPWVGPLRHHRPPFNPLLVRCPHCGVHAGTRCVVPGTNRPPYGGAHPARLDAAQARSNA